MALVFVAGPGWAVWTGVGAPNADVPEQNQVFVELPDQAPQQAVTEAQCNEQAALQGEICPSGYDWYFQSGELLDPGTALRLNYLDSLQNVVGSGDAQIGFNGDTIHWTGYRIGIDLHWNEFVQMDPPSQDLLGEPGALAEQPLDIVAELADLNIFSDGFESGDLSAWSARPGGRVNVDLNKPDPYVNWRPYTDTIFADGFESGDVSAWTDSTGSTGTQEEVTTSSTSTSTEPPAAWETITPRVGLSYDISADRKTLLRQSYARFADQLGAGMPRADLMTPDPVEHTFRDGGLTADDIQRIQSLPVTPIIDRPRLEGYVQDTIKFGDLSTNFGFRFDSAYPVPADDGGGFLTSGSLPDRLSEYRGVAQSFVQRLRDSWSIRDNYTYSDWTFGIRSEDPPPGGAAETFGEQPLVNFTSVVQSPQPIVCRITLENQGAATIVGHVRGMPPSAAHFVRDPDTLRAAWSAAADGELPLKADIGGKTGSQLLGQLIVDYLSGAFWFTRQTASLSPNSAAGQSGGSIGMTVAIADSQCNMSETVYTFSGGGV